MKRCALAVALAVMAGAALAGAPAFVPDADARVLARVHPAAARASAPQPGTDAALRRAALLIEEARRTGDPRFLGRAQALLGAWWREARPPAQALLLRAQIRQSLHEFAPARADLLQLVEREPRHAQGWLTLATVELVMGESASAGERCERLRPLAAEVVAETCAAAVESVRGQAPRALQRVRRALDSGAVASPVKAWARTIEGEVAARLGKPDEAIVAFAAALASDPGDAYARGALVDVLLDAGRGQDALQVLQGLQGPSAQDALLLRKAIAARAAGAPDADALAGEMRERIEAGRARGDRVHLREEARYALEIAGDARGALDIALENWRSQREPADARLALQAALAAREPRRVREVVAAVRAQGLDDPRVREPLLALERL